ncbi:MAG: phospholipase, partial [Actinomycetota bacterium]|nr:phospholipase [Actinomycetota bacterium]
MLLVAAGCSGGGSSPPAQGIHKIRHVIVIMQENRSFDSYFGTYPGADGIPRRHGVPTAC